MWWPPAKIVGRYLAPFLGSFAGVEVPPEPTAAHGAVPIEVELDAETVERSSSGRPQLEHDDGGRAVGDVTSPDPIVVAPEVTRPRRG